MLSWMVVSLMVPRLLLLLLQSGMPEWCVSTNIYWNHPASSVTLQIAYTQSAITLPVSLSDVGVNRS